MPYASELKNSPHRPAENGPNVIVIVLSVTVVVAVTRMGALQRNQPTEPALHLPLLQQPSFEGAGQRRHESFRHQAPKVMMDRFVYLFVSPFFYVQSLQTTSLPGRSDGSDRNEGQKRAVDVSRMPKLQKWFVTAGSTKG